MRRLRVAAIASVLVFGFLAPQVVRAAEAFSNPEELVNGEGPRGEALQTTPDVSSAGWAVWWDARGSATTLEGTAVWAKDLNTRSEARVTVLATKTAFPRISGTWIVYEDVIDPETPSANREVYAVQLPGGTPINVTNDAGAQGFPVIDGTKVVYEQVDTETGIDLYLRDLANLAAPAVLVTDAAGDQMSPEISGNVVVWTDRSTPGEPYVAGRDMTSGGVFTIADPAGVAAEDAAIDGTRVVWSEATWQEPLPGEEGSWVDGTVKTCVLGSGGCTGAATEIATSDGFQSEPEISGTRVVWLEAEEWRAPTWVWFRDLAGAGANLPVIVDAPVNGATFFMDEERGESPKIDGSLVVWQAWLFRGPDVYWKDLTRPDLPQRANSPGLGRFPDQSWPSVSESYVAFLADSGDFNPRNAVWVTELSGNRRNLRVSTFADFGTAISPPKVVGNRVTWSDLRDDDPGMDPPRGTNIFYRDLPGGNETRVTKSGIRNVVDGGPFGSFGLSHPYVDAERTAWVCEETFACVETKATGTITRLALPRTDDGYVVDQQLRVSGAYVLWSEWDFDETSETPWIPTDSKLHAIDVTSGDDTVVASGATGPKGHPAYELNGTDVVWRGTDTDSEVIYRATIGGAGPSVLFDAATDMAVYGLALDGTRVAFAQAQIDVWQTNVWVIGLGGGAAQQVTDEGTAQGDVTLFADYVYWSDFRDGDTDVYREYVGTGSPPSTFVADTAAPTGVTRIAAVVSSDGVRVSWTNPTTNDFAGVIVVRMTKAKTGKPPAAAGIDDPRGTIVYDGSGTTFLDTDVAAGTSYTYTAFTYDEVPNYSAGVATK